MIFISLRYIKISYNNFRCLCYFVIKVEMSKLVIRVTSLMDGITHQKYLLDITLVGSKETNFEIVEICDDLLDDFTESRMKKYLR